MSCEPDIPCNVGSYYTQYLWDVDCLLCSFQKGGCKATACGQNWPVGQVYGDPTKNWIGHGTRVWLLKHGEDPHDKLSESLILAKDYFRGEHGFDGRGHFTLRNYNGHWALERFLPAQTIPFALSNAMAMKTQEAVRWFFDTEAMLSDPGPGLRAVGAEEIAQRINGYQIFIDKETARPWNKEKYLVLPPLCELPEEQQRRLVYHWERLWWGFLDRHPAWRWTPSLGFYKADEEIWPLV